MLRLLKAVTASMTLAAFAGTLPGNAAPIEMTGRTIPFSVDKGMTLSVRGTAPMQLVPSGELVVTAALSADDIGMVYGLLVPGAKPESVIVNGRRLDMDPLLRQDGALYRISEMYLREGANEVRIVRPADARDNLAWVGTTMFSLDGTTEEVHFVQMFAEPAAPRIAPPADPGQAKYDILFYDCNWTPSMSSSVLSAAQVTVRAKSLDSTLSSFVLDFDSNSGSLAVSGVDSGPSTPALAYTVDTANNKLRITLPSAVPAGAEFQARITYSGTPRPSGTFGAPYVRSTHGSPTVAVIYTFSEPYGARQWWPCKDLPDDKATSSVQRITVPRSAGWQVVSNGKLAGVINNGSTETWVWENHYPISTYLLSFTVSNYTYVNATYTSRDGLATMPITHAIFPENSATEGSGAAGTLQVMNFFADRFGEYPFLDEKYFTSSHNSGSGMEHQTCTSMPGGDVFDGMQRRNVHELAHHWFGDKITCQTFDHLWLNEGFATYCEALWDEFKFGPYAFWTRVNGWSVSTTQAVAGPSSDNFSGAAVYRKGAWVLHMLRHSVGDTTFSQILRTWAQEPTHAFGTAISTDFENVAESVSGKDLTAFFSQWLYRTDSTSPPAQPTYRFHANTSRSGSEWVTTFNTNQTAAGTPYVMPLDFEVIYECGTATVVVVNNSAAAATDIVNMEKFVPVEIDLDPDNWVLKNLGLSINTCGLGIIKVNQPFSYRLHASYGSTPYTWSGGAGLPPGLSLASTGIVSGTPTATGNYLVSITVTDNASNTRSATLAVDVTNSTLPHEIIVESRQSDGSGTLTPAPDYQESTAFSNTTSKSAAPGTIGNGTRYTTTVGRSATFRPAIPEAGFYDVFVTLDDRYTGASNDANAGFSVQHDGSNITGQVYFHPYAPGLRNKWLKIASGVKFAAGAAGSAGGVTLTNLDGDGTGSNPQNRFCADAVKFTFVAPLSADVSAWEVF